MNIRGLTDDQLKEKRIEIKKEMKELTKPLLKELTQITRALVQREYWRRKKDKRK